VSVDQLLEHVVSQQTERGATFGMLFRNACALHVMVAAWFLDERYSDGSQSSTTELRPQRGLPQPLQTSESLRRESNAGHPFVYLNSQRISVMPCRITAFRTVVSDSHLVIMSAFIVLERFMSRAVWLLGNRSVTVLKEKAPALTLSVYYFNP
jgi:hypothetical protein